MNTRLRIGLLGKIFIGMAAGVAFGYMAPFWLGRLFATFNYVFSQFLGFLIPLIIVGFVAPAIAELGERAGKMLVFTAALAYAATLIAGFCAYFTADSLFPDMLAGQYMAASATESLNAPAPYFLTSSMRHPKHQDGQTGASMTDVRGSASSCVLLFHHLKEALV